MMTELLQSDARGVARAAALIREGALVAFGTETVYGLGADATDDHAVAGIFAAKGRPRFNPLITHHADTDAAFSDTLATDLARRLAGAFWPGPLTLILPRKNGSRVSLLASAGLDTLAVRVPGHKVALALLRQVGRPVAAPSANRSGRISPTTAEHVMNELSGRIAAVLNCDACAVGVESTVLDLASDEPTLLRPGGVTVEAIEAEIGPVLLRPAGTVSEVLRSPGLMTSHYAPRTQIRLEAVSVEPDEALLAYGEAIPGAGVTFNLSETSDLTDAAACLFAGLHSLDEISVARGLRCIAVMPVPDRGIGRAINDRLRRAATPIE
jgi:L-threonylcarbamoyladenylate synthase